jgi:hypothetical protein
MNTKKTFLSLLSIIFAFLLFSDSIFARVYKLKSPGKQIEVRIHVNQVISYEVHCKGKILIKPSPISMTVHHDGSLSPGDHKNNQKFLRMLHGVQGGRFFQKESPLAAGGR